MPLIRQGSGIPAAKILLISGSNARMAWADGNFSIICCRKYRELVFPEKDLVPVGKGISVFLLLVIRRIQKRYAEAADAYDMVADIQIQDANMAEDAFHVRKNRRLAQQLRSMCSDGL